MEGISNLLLNNPLSQKIISTSKKVLFKNNGEISTASKEIVKTVSAPLNQSLFDVRFLKFKRI